MTVFAKLNHWKEQGVLSEEQHALLTGISRGEPFSMHLELNILLYAGILSLVAGLGWTVNTWSQQLGDVLVVGLLSAMLAACFGYCLFRAPAWSPSEVTAPDLAFDYALYLGCLVWCVELAYLEKRFHLLSGRWDSYLFATACLFFSLAYRFDNRFVLSLALSSLAGWFGLRVSAWPSHQDATYRQSAVLYSLVVAGAGVLLYRRGIKRHFLATHLNIAANILFWALLSGAFQQQRYVWWFLALVAACVASFAWGRRRRQFAFIAYAAVYGYVGVGSILIRGIHDVIIVTTYFVLSGFCMLVLLVNIARDLGGEA